MKKFLLGATVAPTGIFLLGLQSCFSYKTSWSFLVVARALHL